MGAGDTACEEAIYLSKLATTVHMIVRKSEEGMKASKVMQDRVKASSNVKVYWNSETEEIIGQFKTEAVRIKNNKTGQQQTIPISGFFVAIGHEPNDKVPEGHVIRQIRRGYRLKDRLLRPATVVVSSGPAGRK